MRTIVIPLFFCLLVACGGPTREAQTTLTTVSRVVATTDRELAPRYSRASDEAREHSAGWSEYDAAMRDWNTVEAALRTTQSVLFSAQAGMDAWWRSGDERGWLASIPCLVLSIDQLAIGLEAVGIRIEEMSQALLLIRSFTGTCQEMETP